MDLRTTQRQQDFLAISKDAIVFPRDFRWSTVRGLLLRELVEEVPGGGRTQYRRTLAGSKALAIAAPHRLSEVA